MDSEHRANRTERVVLEALEHVVGKESSAWGRWWDHYSRDVEGIGIALYGALLSLGAPPHPDIMTQDLFEIRAASIPRHPKSAYRREHNIVDMQWRRQYPYNKKLNRFAQQHGLVRFHKTQDPAQFRKLFAAFVLHACNQGGDSEVLHQ